MDGTMVRLDDENNIVNFIPKKAFKYSDTDFYYKTVNICKFSKDFSSNPLRTLPKGLYPGARKQRILRAGPPGNHPIGILRF